MDPGVDTRCPHCLYAHAMASPSRGLWCPHCLRLTDALHSEVELEEFTFWQRYPDLAIEIIT